MNNETSTEIQSATLKISEVATMLGINKNTAYSLARQGKLPGALRLGGRWVVSRKVIEALLDGKDV